MKLEDLQPGMELKGTVLNVVDFGAFVDVGLKDSGLVHISQIANRFIRSPYELVAVGDVVTVWVLQVDHERRRVSLTMIRPGTQSKPPERKPREPRPQTARQHGADRPAQRRGGPPRPNAPRRQGPPAQGAPGSPPAAVNAESAATSPPPARVQPPPPRKPQRTPPRPKLSKAALEGEAPLRTFSELEAFFKAKDEPVKEPKRSEPPPAAGPADQTPPAP